MVGQIGTARAKASGIVQRPIAQTRELCIMAVQRRDAFACDFVQRTLSLLPQEQGVPTAFALDCHGQIVHASGLETLLEMPNGAADGIG